MDKEELITLALKAGMKDSLMYEHIKADAESLAAFANLVAQHEREACAKVCDAEQKKNEDNGQWMWEAKTCGIAIRARGQA